MITTEELRNSLGLDTEHFNDTRASEAIDEVNALAVVYAGGQDSIGALTTDQFEALRQVVKRFAKRVYSNPEGVLQRQITATGSTSYADTSEAAHGLTKHLHRAVRAAVGGATAKAELYATERPSE